MNNMFGMLEPKRAMDFPIARRAEAMAKFAGFYKTNQLSWDLPALELPPQTQETMVRLVPSNIMTLKDVPDPNTLHTCPGKFLLGRTICKSKRLNQMLSLILIDDPEGQLAASVVVTNFVSDIPGCCNSFTGDLPVGSIVAIMNPSYSIIQPLPDAKGQLPQDLPPNQIHLSCLNPAHFHVLGIEHPLLKNEAIEFKEPLSKYCPSEVVYKTDLELDKIGKWYLEGGHNSLMAIECLTEALQQQIGDVAENLEMRSQALLAIGHPALALYDIERALKITISSRGISRKAVILLEMGRYRECYRWLRSFDGREYREVMFDAWTGLQEGRTGNYNMTHMRNEAEASPYLPRYHADYAASSLIKVIYCDDGPMLVAKSDIEAGTLLLASRAWAYAASDDQWSLERIFETIRLAKSANFTKDTRPSVCEWSTKQDPINDYRRNLFDVYGSTYAIEGRGLWISDYIGTMRYRCVNPNCAQIFIGDFVFFRAVSPVEAGEQLTLSDVKADYDYMLRHLLNRHNNHCPCELCHFERSESPAVAAKMIQTLIGIRQLRVMCNDDKKSDEQLNKGIEAAKEALKECEDHCSDPRFNFAGHQIQLVLAKLLWKFPKRRPEAFDIMKKLSDVYEGLHLHQAALSLCEQMLSFLSMVQGPYWKSMVASCQNQKDRLCELLYGSKKFLK